MSMAQLKQLAVGPLHFDAKKQNKKTPPNWGHCDQTFGDLIGLGPQTSGNVHC